MRRIKRVPPLPAAGGGWCTPRVMRRTHYGRTRRMTRIAMRPARHNVRSRRRRARAFAARPCIATDAMCIGVRVARALCNVRLAPTHAAVCGRCIHYDCIRHLRLGYASTAYDVYDTLRLCTCIWPRTAAYTAVCAGVRGPNMLRLCALRLAPTHTAAVHGPPYRPVCPLAKSARA
jgi:hypothetical protein